MLLMLLFCLPFGSAWFSVRHMWILCLAMEFITLTDIALRDRSRVKVGMQKTSSQPREDCLQSMNPAVQVQDVLLKC
jgi:hypothetical protein